MGDGQVEIRSNAYGDRPSASASGFEVRDAVRAELGPNAEDIHYLELQDEESGLRYYLEGQPLHAGDLVSVFTNHGWENARYEWNYSEECRPPAIFDEEHAIRIEESTPCRQPVV